MDGDSTSGTDHIVIDVVDEYKKYKKCIFRVPKVLRRQNPEAYTPDIVSIGPFHYQGKRGQEEVGEGKEDFQLMELVKKSYLNEILSGMDITLKHLTAKVTKLSDQKNEGGFEERARGFYAESLDHIFSEDFIEMMIVDGCFLIQLFRKCNHSKLRALDDPIFNMDCMFHFLCHDILLLENQLPWFVIHTLYALTLDIYPSDPSLSFLILTAFTILPSLEQSYSSYNKHLHKKCHSDADVLHILDLVRASIVVPLMAIDERQHTAAGIDAIFYPKQHQMHTATALSKAGIKFKGVIEESILDIRLEEDDGVLTFPQLNVGMSSESLFRNLIAIEQCYHGYSNEITSYVILMDNLISSKEDMELLCKENIIGDWLSYEDGCKFFNNLYKDIPHNKFYYAGLCKQLDDQYYSSMHVLIGEKTKRRFKYFIYGIVGVFFLQIVPTLLQTGYTIKQYYSP